MSCRDCPNANEATGSTLPRRRLLVLGAVAAGLAACRADADTGYLLGMDPGGDDAGNGDDVDNSGDDAGNPDDTVMLDDAGNPIDVPISNTDSGNPRDTGTPRDSGTTIVDSGPPPMDSGPTCTPGPTMLGATSSFPVGTWTKKTTPRVIVAQDSSGFYVYSSVCTHQGCVCDPPDSSGQAYCACHGSLFGPNGEVLQGPATRPLPHYAVTVCAGIVYVNTSMTVSASTRTPAG